MKKLIIASILALSGIASSQAADFFDTSRPDNLFNLGVRVGMNTATRNIKNDVFDVWNSNTWGTGFDAGIVADINFRDYISIQPGIFYESRSNKYTYIYTNAVSQDGPTYVSQFGKDRSYTLQIPILCSIHFNLCDNIRWNVEAGPYFHIFLKNKVEGDLVYPVYKAQNATPTGLSAVKPSSFDFGIKLGTSIKFLDHYLVGVHYLAGCLHPWKDGAIGGRNKAWTFTLGYDF